MFWNINETSNLLLFVHSFNLTVRLDVNTSTDFFSRNVQGIKLCLISAKQVKKS